MKDGSVESWLLNTYSVCNSLAESKAIKDRIFCLDRMSDFRPSHHTFTYPSDFSPKDFFEGSFGIINDQDCAVQTVRLKVDAQQSNYLRDLPLHESQREVERTEAYSIFTVCVRRSTSSRSCYGTARSWRFWNRSGSARRLPES